MNTCLITCNHYYVLIVAVTICLLLHKLLHIFVYTKIVHEDIALTSISFSICCPLDSHNHSLISSLFVISICSHNNNKLLGNIGSGKTTLLTHVRELLQDKNLNQKIIFLKEPVDVWETIKDEEGKTMLEKFYADQEKYSFAFQMMVFIFFVIHQPYHSLTHHLRHIYLDYNY